MARRRRWQYIGWPSDCLEGDARRSLASHGQQHPTRRQVDEQVQMTKWVRKEAAKMPPMTRAQADRIAILFFGPDYQRQHVNELLRYTDVIRDARRRRVKLPICSGWPTGPT